MQASLQWMDRRSSGVLAHVSALPGRFGIGNIGAGARTLLDRVKALGFQRWQICPVGPTGYGDSPYQLFSSFAGNPYLLDLQEWVSEGLLTEAELSPLIALPKERVDYGQLYARFYPLAERAATRFFERPPPAAYLDFLQREAEWLEPYVHFMALKAAHGGAPWNEWPAPLRSWAGAQAARPEGLEPALQLHRFLQYCFSQQWSALLDYAHGLGVEVIGDLPIFVSYDSAECWQDPTLFMIDAAGQPITVAGVPPDYYSELGQLWGNPLYRWERHEATGFAWWFDRLRANLKRYDIVRIDHFRGFDSYWSIPAGATDARGGRWLRAPGVALFEKLQEALPGARFIAEDLGYITREVKELRERFGLPGMKILQFAFGHDAAQINLPVFYERNCVVYTGTHDNDTSRGLLQALPPEVKAEVDAFFGTDAACSAWPLIRAAFASVAYMAVVPLADLLDLPSEARFNTPGTASGNWSWRVSEAQLDALEAEAGDRLRRWHARYHRQNELRADFSADPNV